MAETKDITEKAEDELSSTEETNAHNKYTDAYINILETYRGQIKGSIDAKNKLKDKFFRMIRLIMYILIGLFVVALVSSFVIFVLMVVWDYKSVAVITGAVTAMVSSFVTMIISIIKLPEIIAMYLFNKEEDNLMSEVIKNIQDYEIEAVKSEYVAALDATKDKSFGYERNQILEDSPNTSGKRPESLPERLTEEELEAEVTQLK